MVKEYLEEINGKAVNDINTFSGGLNTYIDKAFIDASQTPYALNMGMYQPPMMCTRPSREHIILMDHVAPQSSIVTMWAWDESHFFLITRKNDLSKEQRLFCVQKLTSAVGHVSWISHEFTNANLPSGVNLYFCYCRTEVAEYLYLGNDTYKAKFTLDTTIEDMLLSFRVITDGYYGTPCWHKGRLFLSNSVKGTVTFSALNDFDNFDDPVIYQVINNPYVSIPADADTNVTYLFSADDFSYYSYHYDNGAWVQGANVSKSNVTVDSNGRSIIDYSSYAGYFLVTNAKGKITTIISFDDKLVIFCEHSMHLLYGDTPLTTSSYQFQLVDMNNNLGCIAPKTVAIGGGCLFWLGDDKEVYSYTGSSIDMISRPNTGRYVQRLGSISNLPTASPKWTDGSDSTVGAIATATSNKYYIMLPLELETDVHFRTPLFVYDTYNKVWWCEDGALNAIANFSSGINGVIMANWNEEIVKSQNKYDGYDLVYDVFTDTVKKTPIYYEYHTKVFGVDGVDSRKTLSKVWLQASASANVYLSDSWTSSNNWTIDRNDNSWKKIGRLGQKGQKDMHSDDYLETYDSDDYEQQECIVPKMYGERLNSFQLIIKGQGPAKFYLMKREWSAR